MYGATAQAVIAITSLAASTAVSVKQQSGIYLSVCPVFFNVNTVRVQRTFRSFCPISDTFVVTEIYWLE